VNAQGTVQYSAVHCDKIINVVVVKHSDDTDGGGPLIRWTLQWALCHPVESKLTKFVLLGLVLLQL
jgi:hypothetical protein